MHRAAGQGQGQFSLIDPIANQPGCATAVLDRTARRITLTVPASCLGDPDWVRVGNGVILPSAAAGSTPTTPAATRPSRHEGWKYGPKVTAG